jgi:AraC-like DNA-binding protein
MSYTPEIVPAAIFSLRANILVNYAVELGATLEDMLQDSGVDLPRYRQNHVYVTVEQYMTMVRNFVRRFPTAGLGLEFGRRLNITARGTLGLAVLSMQTLNEVVRFSVKYQEVLEVPQTASLEMREDGLHLVFRYDETIMRNPALQRFLVESNFSSYMHTSRYLLQMHFDPVLVAFNFSEPADTNAYHQLFGRRVIFGADTCRMVFSREILETRLPSSNPLVARACYEACDDLLRTYRKNQTLTYRINGILLQRHGDYPTLKELSAMLNLDERTVRRRLAMERTSYKALLNEARKRHASRLLSVRSNSVESVAMALGFNNASNFRRAFKAWTGLNPGEYREQPERPWLAASGE